MTTPYRGCDDLRDWLQDNGCKVYNNSLSSQHNECNWYAAKPRNPAARKCECNDDPPQIIIYPHKMQLGAATYESVEVDLTGEAGGIWYKLCAYSLTHDDLRERLDDIERQLVRAWNAIGNDPETP